jgi:hypothetical protein
MFVVTFSLGWVDLLMFVVTFSLGWVDLLIFVVTFSLGWVDLLARLYEVQEASLCHHLCVVVGGVQC